MRLHAAHALGDYCKYDHCKGVHFKGDKTNIWSHQHPRRGMMSSIFMRRLWAERLSAGSYLHSGLYASIFLICLFAYLFIFNVLSCNSRAWNNTNRKQLQLQMLWATGNFSIHVFQPREATCTCLYANAMTRVFLCDISALILVEMALCSIALNEESILKHIKYGYTETRMTSLAI